MSRGAKPCGVALSAERRSMGGRRVSATCLLSWPLANRPCSCASIRQAMNVGKGSSVAELAPAIQYHAPLIFSNRHCNILLMTSAKNCCGRMDEHRTDNFFLQEFFCFCGMCHAVVSPNPDSDIKTK